MLACAAHTYARAHTRTRARARSAASSMGALRSLLSVCPARTSPASCRSAGFWSRHSSLYFWSSVCLCLLSRRGTAPVLAVSRPPRCGGGKGEGQAAGASAPAPRERRTHARTRTALRMRRMFCPLAQIERGALAQDPAVGVVLYPGFLKTFDISGCSHANTHTHTRAHTHTHTHTHTHHPGLSVSLLLALLARAVPASRRRAARRRRYRPTTVPCVCVGGGGSAAEVTGPGAHTLSRTRTHVRCLRPARTPPPPFPALSQVFGPCQFKLS